jgi:RNA 3'-terminal phosphate cyclase (ATP)
VELKKRGEFEGIDVYSIATEDLQKREVAERQVSGFLKEVSPKYEVRRIDRAYVDAESTGSSFHACARFANTRLGVCAIGEREVKAEDVGANAGRELLAELESNAPLDRHMTDQIIPYIALLGGHIRVPALTEHAKTNIDVVNMFGYRVKAEGNVILASR